MARKADLRTRRRTVLPARHGAVYRNLLSMAWAPEACGVHVAALFGDAAFREYRPPLRQVRSAHAAMRRRL